jgi:hypothetical protein
VLGPPHSFENAPRRADRQEPAAFLAATRQAKERTS